jgi:DNA-binding CsgD family transcriptional regulator
MTMMKPRAKANGTSRARRAVDVLPAPTEETRAAADGLRAMLRAALDLVASPAFALAPSGQILESNAAGRDWLGRDPTRAEALRGAARGRAPAGVVVTPVRETGGALLLVNHELAERGDGSGLDLFAAASRRWGFTPREREVLTLLVDGCSNRTIAATLSIAVRTVETHLSSMFEKAAVDSRAELVAQARRP